MQQIFGKYFYENTKPNMAILKNTAHFILDALAQTSGDQHSTDFARRWFLSPPDDKTSIRLADPNKSDEYKLDLIADKLEDLAGNAEFGQQLAALLRAEQGKAQKNVVENSQIEAGGNVEIGDKGSPADQHFQQKNVITGSSIKAGGNFSLGDTSGHESFSLGSQPPAAPVLHDLNYGFYLKTLVQENELEKAIQLALKATPNISRDLSNALINLSARFAGNRRSMRDGILDYDAFNRENNKLRMALLSVIEDLDHDAQWQSGARTNPGIRPNVQIPEEKDLERVLGNKEHLVKIAWLQHGLRAAKSVCRVVLPNGNNGTGFVLEGGYLLTNFHVLRSPKQIEEALVEFNFEEDMFGTKQQVTAYKLDVAGHKLSGMAEFDYCYAKIIDNPAQPLAQWGFLEIDTFSEPQKGDPVNIIQHPEAGVKQIALTYNYVLGLWAHRLFYQTDTKPGSSGSPVFNKDWKVVALHHKGQTMENGGLQINENGDRMGANEGILMKYILEDIKK